MVAALGFDTTFLIDLQRERWGDDGPAHDFLRAHAEDGAEICVVALGEYAEGFADWDDPALRALRDVFLVRDVDQATCRQYATVVRQLRVHGRLIGANDLWIAASALRHGTGLVTRNVREFSRVPGLRVVPY